MAVSCLNAAIRILAISSMVGITLGHLHPPPTPGSAGSFVDVIQTSGAECEPSNTDMALEGSELSSA
jgi:hypothetical protein